MCTCALLNEANIQGTKALTFNQVIDVGNASKTESQIGHREVHDPIVLSIGITIKLYLKQRITADVYIGIKCRHSFSRYFAGCLLASLAYLAIFYESYFTSRVCV